MKKNFVFLTHQIYIHIIQSSDFSPHTSLCIYASFYILVYQVQKKECVIVNICQKKWNLLIKIDFQLINLRKK